MVMEQLPKLEHLPKRGVLMRLSSTEFRMLYRALRIAHADRRMPRSYRLLADRLSYRMKAWDEN